MPRLRADISGKRLRELVDAGFDVFCRQGFERSQVADVAKVMGVAVGTVYLYVESKEALFDLVVRHTTMEDPEWLDAIEIPVPTPEPGSTTKFLSEVFGREGQWPKLEAALKKKKATSIRSEFTEIIQEQYQLMKRHRKGLVLLLRSALEYPGLADVFVLGLRKRLLETLQKYIDLRVKGGQLAQPKNVMASAAVLTQTIAWANLQRPFDPGLTLLTEQAAEDATVDMLVNGLLNAKP